MAILSEIITWNIYLPLMWWNVRFSANRRRFAFHLNLLETGAGDMS